MFEREVPANSLECWMPEEFDGYPGIAIANRYFSDRRNAGKESDLRFRNETDPYGILQRSKGRDFVHLSDNVVDYFEMNSTATGKK